MPYRSAKQTRTHGTWYVPSRRGTLGLAQLDCSKRRGSHHLAIATLDDYVAKRRNEQAERVILVSSAADAAQQSLAYQPKPLEKRFREQVEKWDRETAHLSAPAQRFAHPSYMAILGMAEENRQKVVDLLLRDMQENRREWFWALSYLTHENPIERKDAGKLDRMIDAWVHWAQRDRGRR